MKKIPGEYLSGGCDNLSNLLGMIGLACSGIWVGWSEAKSFGCAESVGAELVLEESATREANLVLRVGLALLRKLPFGL